MCVCLCEHVLCLSSYQAELLTHTHTHGYDIIASSLLLDAKTTRQMSCVSVPIASAACLAAMVLKASFTIQGKQKISTTHLPAKKQKFDHWSRKMLWMSGSQGTVLIFVVCLAQLDTINFFVLLVDARAKPKRATFPICWLHLAWFALLTFSCGIWQFFRHVDMHVDTPY